MHSILYLKLNTVLQILTGSLYPTLSEYQKVIKPLWHGYWLETCYEMPLFVRKPTIALACTDGLRYNNNYKIRHMLISY